jgi:hypothetical protein
MTGRTSSPKLPGRWLEAVARAVFDEPALSHAALPAIADLQQDWFAAGADRRRRWLARWRGYVAFWSLVLIAPVAFRTTAVRSRAKWSRTRRLSLAVVAIVVVAIIVAAAGLGDVVEVWLYLVFLDLGGVWTAIGRITQVAFLAGPLMIAFFLLCRRTVGPWGASFPFSVLALFSLLSVTVAGFASGASVVGLRSGGNAVLVAVSDAALAMRNGLLTALACLLFTGAIGGREWWRDRFADGSPPNVSRPQAWAWSGLLVATLVGVDQLLRAHHSFMRALTLMADADFARWSASQQVIVTDTFHHSLLLLLVGGCVLTSVVVLAGVKGWRVARGRGSHPLFTWVSRAALIVAVLGAAFHARVVVTDFASFHETVGRLIEHQRTNPPRRTG